MPRRATAALPADNLQTALTRRLHRAVDAMAGALSPEKQADLVALGDDMQVLAALASMSLLETKRLANGSSVARAIARGIAIKESLLAEAGGSLSSEQVAGLLRVSRETIAKYRRANKLLGLPKPSGDYQFPVCQFESERVIAGLERALAAFRTPDPWSRLQVLLTADPNLGQRTPIDALKAGEVEAVVQAIAAYDSD